MDDRYLVIWGDNTWWRREESNEIPWRYMNEQELKEFLSERIEEGYTFPLNPKWILCDPGWKELYDKLLASNREEVKQSMAIWFPPDSGVREQIKAICRRHKSGFEGGPLRSQEQVQKRFTKLLKEEGIIYRKTTGICAKKGVKGQTIATTVHGVLETENTIKDDNSWIVRNNVTGEYYIVADEVFQATYDAVDSSAGSQYNTMEPVKEEIEEEGGGKGNGSLGEKRTSSSSVSSSTKSMFARLYRKGFREYTPKNQVCRYARKVTEEDMKWFRFGLPPKPYEDLNAAFFIAPWRAYTRVEKDDVLVMQYNEDGGGSNNEIYRIEGYVFSASYEPLNSLRRLSSKSFEIIDSNSFREVYESEDDTESSRVLAGKDGRPVRSQKEVQDHFVSKLIDEGNLHRKSESAYLRRAIKGEKVLTVLDGVPETENIVRDDNSWIACGKTAYERYIIKNDVFQAVYASSPPKVIDSVDEDSILKRLHREGFMEYKAQKTIFGHQVTEDDMEWFHFDDPPPNGGDDVAAHFVAPWGECMRVEAGDWIVMSYPEGNPEIYRVEGLVFDVTYKAVFEI